MFPDFVKGLFIFYRSTCFHIEFDPFSTISVTQKVGSVQE